MNPSPACFRRIPAILASLRVDVPGIRLRPRPGVPCVQCLERVKHRVLGHPEGNPDVAAARDVGRGLSTGDGHDGSASRSPLRAAAPRPLAQQLEAVGTAHRSLEPRPTVARFPQAAEHAYGATLGHGEVHHGVQARTPSFR